MSEKRWRLYLYLWDKIVSWSPNLSFQCFISQIIRSTTAGNISRILGANLKLLASDWSCRIRCRFRISKVYISRLTRNMKCFEWFSLCSLIMLLSSPSYIYGNVINDKVLHVGEELFKETLPLQSGARLYHLQGLKPQTWYEVKISHPASIPARFSLQLKRGTPDVGLNQGRKLLNTEKIIFKTDGITSLIERGDMSVLVNVEPEGVLAIPGKQEREYIMFNIVCDELLLGIPHEAWYVVVFVLLGLVLAFVVPSYLPAFLLPKNGRQPLFDHTVTKAS